TGYLRALDRAEAALDADLAKYLPLWKLAVPAEFENHHPWDFSKFGRGERFVYETIPRAEFDEVMDQVKRWGLDQYLKDRNYEKLSYPVTAYERPRRTNRDKACGPPRGRLRACSRAMTHSEISGCFPRLRRHSVLARRGYYVPTASPTHFFIWLVFAAPARFFCLESASQVVVASFSHFVMKLLSAAPASFLSAASDLQVANAGADETRQTASANTIFFIVSSLEDRDRNAHSRL